MISIIGGGPVGCYVGYLLAKKGLDVNIFEQHKEIGEPVHCTGLVTSKIKDYFDLPKELIINEIQDIRIYSPNDCLKLKLKNSDYVLDRKGLDKYLAKMAEQAGAKIRLGARLVGFEENKIRIKENDKINLFDPDFVVGADGPLSKVSDKINHKKNNYMVGVQVRAKLKNDNAIEFYPHIGAFAWVVPENKEVVRIGIAAYEKPNEVLKNFLELKKVNEIIEYQGGIIPIYRNKKIQDGNLFLLGDAAGQVKATTGGGLIPGFEAAKTLSKAISEKKYYKPFKLNLRKNLLLRKVMDKFSNKDWDKLIEIFKKTRNKNILESIDRDNILRLSLKLVKEPRLFRFIKYLKWKLFLNYRDRTCFMFILVN